MFCFDSVLKSLFTEKLAEVNLWDFSMWWLTSILLYLHIYVQIGDLHRVHRFELFLHSILDIKLLRICHLKKKDFKWLYTHIVKTCQEDSPGCHCWFLLVSLGISDHSTCKESSTMMLLPFIFFQPSLRVFFSPYYRANRSTMVQGTAVKLEWNNSAKKILHSKDVRTVRLLCFCSFLWIPWTNSKRSGLCIWKKLRNTRKFRWKYIKVMSAIWWSFFARLSKMSLCMRVPVRFLIHNRSWNCFRELPWSCYGQNLHSGCSSLPTHAESCFMD